MMVRSFSLINEYGQEYSLNSPDLTGFLTEPKGLGYEYAVNYIDIGDAFIRTKRKAKQSTVSGTMIFGSRSPYELYNKFNAYIRSSQELKLVYQTPGSSRAYYRDVDLVKLEKTEMEKGVLQCAVDFYCKSLFYSNVQNNFVVTTVEGELRYTIKWPARYNDYSERTIMLTNNGDVGAPFMLEIQGYCEKPTVTMEKDGEMVACIKFPVILQPGEKILYSSLDDDMYVYQVDGEGNKTNIIQLLDIAYTNFFKVPPGDYSISFTSDTGAAYTTSLTMYKFYRTV